MRLIAQNLFDVYALALPRGHGFGRNPPVEAWETDDGNSCGIVLRNVDDDSYGLLVMRRRVDSVWTVVEQKSGLNSYEVALASLTSALIEDHPSEPLPPNTAPRPALHDVQGRQPSELFKHLSRPTHHNAAWVLSQLYLALPTPDPNWASDFQTGNFHTRLWEVFLLASFREQGLLVTQPHPSPDFRIENRAAGEAWVEAVTANPSVPYEHVGARPSRQPDNKEELFSGPVALRFAKTIGSKLQQGYAQLPHVVGSPFALAIADFQAPGSMVWSREALIGYLYGFRIDLTNQPEMTPVDQLLGDSGFPSGLFCDDGADELSAVIFSNACAISKFYRVPVSGGASVGDFKYARIGEFFDRSPGAHKGIPFSLDITSRQYRDLWPQGYEPWSAELEVFHNSFASRPLAKGHIPEATHWFERDGEMICESHYETSILWSITQILNKTESIRTIEEILAVGLDKES